MKRALLIAGALIAVLTWACTKQSLKATYDKQTTYIESFITAQMKADTNARLTRNQGAYRLTLHDTLDVHRDSLRAGGRVSLFYACYVLSSSSVSASNLVATNRKETATAAGWKLTDTLQFRQDTLTLDGTLLNGFYMGLEGVQPKDEGYILFTGEFGYGKLERGTIPAKSALAYHIWIDDIYNE